MSGESPTGDRKLKHDSGTYKVIRVIENPQWGQKARRTGVAPP